MINEQLLVISYLIQNDGFKSEADRMDNVQMHAAFTAK